MESLKLLTQKILNDLDCPDSELSILITDDKHIEELNRKYLQRTGPTNVISFSLQEGEFSNINPQILGDVVISYDTALREAAQANMSFDERLYYLLIHGILHILGYDHENNEHDAEIMEKKTEELLNIVY